MNPNQHVCVVNGARTPMTDHEGSKTGDGRQRGTSGIAIRLERP